MNHNSGCNSNGDCRILLMDRLARLDFNSFQRLVWLWLGVTGHTHMRFLGRRSRRGTSGPDFLARLGRDGMDIAIQIRHWKTPISKRAVDELRGILLRDDFSGGMIVAASACSKAAKLTAANFNGRPIRIIGIDRLAESLIGLGMGVGAGNLDERFFRMIDGLRLGTGPARIARLPKPNSFGFRHSPEDPGPERDASWWILLALTVLSIVIIWSSVR